jgi:hypothetical protein
MIFVRGSRKEHYQEVRIPVIVTGANKMLANLLKKLHILHKCGCDGNLTPTQKRYTSCIGYTAYVSSDIVVVRTQGDIFASSFIYIRQTMKFLKGICEIRASEKAAGNVRRKKST